MNLLPIGTIEKQKAILTEVGNSDYSAVGESKIITLASTPHWALFNFISSTTGLVVSAQEKAIIVQNVKIKKLRKRQFFLQESDVCKYIGFITSGSTRMFSVNERGQESIVSFGLENNFIVDPGSFSNNEPSGYYIEALEDTCLLTMSCAQFYTLKTQVPAFSNMFDRYQLNQLIEIQKRINSALSMSAEERYFDLIYTRPDYVKRFSQNMLACYLGVKAETLSRIRKLKV